MSSQNRREYLTATSLTQSVLDNCHDNLECRLEMIVEIETPSGIIYASDRNKYVGDKFYEALLVFPTINRTVGEWLANELTFSTLTLELSNADERFNEFLPGGASFDGWMGKTVTVKLGLAEQASTYTTIFSGHITDVGGFKRTIKSVVIIARDDYEKINVNFPTTTFSDTTYAKIGNDILGKHVPIIYGDWTTDTEPSPAGVPTFVVNGNDPFLTYKEVNVDTNSPASPCVFTRLNHGLDNNDIIQLTTNGTLPAPFAVTTDYFVVNKTIDTFQLSLTSGGPAINSTTAGSGSHRFAASPTATEENIKLVVSSNVNAFFDSDNVYLKRQDQYWLVPSSEIVNLNADKNYFEVKQNSAVLWLNSLAYLYETGDIFLVKVKGKDLGAYDNNPVWQARDLLITYGGLVSGDFHSNWATFRDATTAKSRIYVSESQSVLTYALSILEQILLEAFVDRSLKLKINSLRFSDWTPAPTYTVKNWDVESGSFNTSVDERNNFNRAQAAYNFLPEKNENAYLTSVYKNTSAITQTGKAISKRIVFPNIYLKTDVVYYLQEILKLASSGLESITINLTWRSLLKDIGEFIAIDVKIGSTQFENVPCMVREIGYDPAGLKLPVKMWCMTMVPFPGYVPGYIGTVGGYNATIDEET